MDQKWAYDVFLSHSSQDKAVVRALAERLRADGVRVWLDEKAIRPGTIIPRAIGQGLEDARVYVLAMSQPAFDSHWVEAELNAVLMRDPTNAQGRLLPVLLADCPIPALLQSVSHVDYRNRSDAAYNTILEVCSPTAAPRTAAHPTSPGPDRRFELTVDLTLANGQLIRRYYNSRGDLLSDYCSPWGALFDTVPLYAQLFDLLFGSPDESRVQGLFTQLGGQRPPTPIYEALRVCIHTSEPHLAALPWALTRWHDERLTEQEWTFEVIATSPETNSPRYRVELPAPFPVVLLAPPGNAAALAWDTHRRDVEQQLRDAWRVTLNMVHVPATRADLLNLQRQGGPPLGLLYYHGPGVIQNDKLCLSLVGTSRRPAPVETLLQGWGPGRVQAVFLNLLQQEPLPLGATLAACSRAVPLVIVQSARPEEAQGLQQAFLDWLHAVLQGTEPLRALHDKGHRSAIAWGNYDTWRLDRRGRDAIPMEQMAHFLLNRTQERDLVNRAVDELIEYDKRVTCIIAYADTGNRVDVFFPDQARDYLRRRARDKVSVELFQLPFPANDVPGHVAFEQVVRRAFAIGDTSLERGLARALEQLRAQKFAGKLRDNARPLLLLAWSTWKTTLRSQIEAVLTTWLRWNQRYLCAACPPNLHVLSCLAMESSSTQHSLIHSTVEHMQMDRDLLQDRTFTLEQPAHLRHVAHNELVKFFREHQEQLRCSTQDLCFDLAEVIYRKTSGHYAAILDLMQERQTWGWETLLQRWQQS